MSIISDMYDTQAALGLQRIVSDFRHDRETASWKSYAKSLEEKLAETQDKLSFEKAQNLTNAASSEGRLAIINRLTDELAKTDPSNPLLDERELWKIKYAVMAPMYAQKGYRLLPDGKVEKM